MKYMKIKYIIQLCILAALVLTACTDELSREQVPVNGHGISFSVSVTNGWDAPASGTRGVQFASISEPVQMEGGSQSLFLQAEVLDGIMMRKNSQLVKDTVEAQQPVYPKLSNALGRYKEEVSKAATRGVMRTAANMYDAIGVLAYSFSGSWDGSQTPDFMYNLKAAKGSTVYETTKDWPGNETHLRFYAYAPHSEEAEGITLSAASVAGVPTLTYEVPADVTKQSDLLATLCDETASAPHASPQSMELHHLLTAVCFKIGDGMAAGTINKITLKNIKYKGTYAFPSATPWTSDKGSWVVDSDVRDFVYTPSPAFSTDGTANVQINTGENVFMMLPQTLSDDAAVEVEFTDENSNTDTYSANINAITQWEQGKTVTYAISLDPTSYILTVAPPAGDYVFSGETKGLTVTSYKEYNGVKTSLGWTITDMEYSYDNGTTWSSVSNQLVFSTTTGTGGATPENLTAQIRQTGYEYAAPYDDALTNATEVTTRRDLSYYDVKGNNTGSRNTANCYVVRAPGKYRFPCVYGNAIKNGATNTSSYISTFDLSTIEENYKSYMLMNFKNAYNDNITDPWIHKNLHDGNAIIPTTAEIAWQDHDNIIRDENISITQEGDAYYVDFEVKKEDIMLGNAVIQVKDGSGIVQWSWHIWMTSADLTTAGPFTNQTSHQYSFLPQPVGYVEKEVTVNFLPRLFRVKVVQTESGKEAIFNLTQAGDNTQSDVYYAAPYYQWGRKDPMPMEDIAAFTIGTRSSNLESPFIYQAIRTPCVFYAHPGSSGSTDKNWHGGLADQTTATEYPRIDNLWDANYSAYGAKRPDGVSWSNGAVFSDNAVTKTIYDPSPAGFHVPGTNAFSGFTEEYATWRSDVNNSDWTYGYSVVFQKDGKQLIIPACGQREQDGHIDYYPYWGMFCISARSNYWGDAFFTLTAPTGSEGSYTFQLWLGENYGSGYSIGVGDACQAYNVMPAAD